MWRYIYNGLENFMTEPIFTLSIELFYCKLLEKFAAVKIYHYSLIIYLKIISNNEVLKL